MTTLRVPTAGSDAGERPLRELALHEQGRQAIRIAEAVRGTRGAVSQSLARAREGGREALRRRPLPAKAVQIY